MSERRIAQNVYVALRAKWDSLKVRHHPLSGPVRLAVPLVHARPKRGQECDPSCPAEPSGRLERIPDAKLLLHRDGYDVPLIVEQDFAA
jgi:hypothetical protein